MHASNTIGTNQDAAGQPAGLGASSVPAATAQRREAALGAQSSGAASSDVSGLGGGSERPNGRDPQGASISLLELGSERQVEFLPVRIRQQRLRRRRLIRQGYLLAMCIAVMGMLTYVRQGRLARARGDLVVLEKRESDLRLQVAMIAPLERQMANLLIKKRIDGELGSQTDCTAVLAELCRITPPNVVMISLDLKTVELRTGASGQFSSRLGQGFRGARPAGAVAARGWKGSPASADGAANAVRRVRVEVTGLAPTDVDVANFIGQLSASQIFEDVSMGYTKTVVFRGRSAREFQVSWHLVR